MQIIKYCMLFLIFIVSALIGKYISQKYKDRLEELEEGKTTTFDKVLLVSDGDKVTVGTDTVKGAKVKATVVGHGKAKKVVVFKYKPKKNERKVRGHRQPYTKIQIEKITTGTRAKKAATTEEVAE